MATGIYAYKNVQVLQYMQDVDQLTRFVVRDRNEARDCLVAKQQPEEL